MVDLEKATTEEDVVNYVSKFARYHDRLEDGLYAVRHPRQYSSDVMFSKDTRDLVVRLAKEYAIEVTG